MGVQTIGLDSLPQAPPGTVLAVNSYAPVSTATYQPASTTFADLDATNMAVTFIAPPNGIVLIDLEAVANGGTTSTLLWAVSHTTAGRFGDAWMEGASAIVSKRMRLRCRVTGLQGGVSYKFTWQHCYSAAGGTVPSTYAGQSSGSASIGPASMTVLAAV